MIEDKSLNQSVSEVQNAFRSHSPNSDSWILPNNFWIASTVLGGKIWEVYARVRWLITQSLPDTAVGEVLERWGNIFAVVRQQPTAATGLVKVTGQDGAVIELGKTVIISSRHKYVVTETAQIEGGEALIRVQAETSGSQGNAAKGTPTKLTSTFNTVDVSGEVISIGGGTDKELDKFYRRRILARMRNRNRYGSLVDYEEWAQEVPGVTRSWARKIDGVINVFFMMDSTYPQKPPHEQDLQIVDDYLNDRKRKPACAMVTAQMVQEKVLIVEFECESVELAKRKQIVDELDAFLLDEARPGKSFSAHDIQAVLNGVCDVRIDCKSYWVASGAQLFMSSKVMYV